MEYRPTFRRDLELMPIQHQGQQMILVRDPLGLVPEGQALPVPLYQVAALLDGGRTVRDLQMEFTRQMGGALVSMNDIEKVLDHLDHSFLLESQAFQEAREGMIKAFVSQTVRSCSHCGKAYPRDPDELGNWLDGFIEKGAQQKDPLNASNRIVALVAPHIDIRVGGRAYGRAYACLRGRAPKRVIILGVGHQMMDGLFCLTDKDFEMPGGVVKNDRDLTHRLMAEGAGVMAADDFVHRSEHSVEFQVLFLQHLIGAESFAIIPVLCGSMMLGLEAYSRKAYLEKTQGILDMLRSIVSDESSDTLVVAGVDFSHIGLKFGHQTPAGNLEQASRAHDRHLLDSLVSQDPDQFWAESVRIQDQYHVCGFPALACLLEILPRCRGDILDYDMWQEEATRSAVGFAAAAFSEEA
jgi:AmmeMemoRadiSam system protein B